MNRLGAPSAQSYPGSFQNKETVLDYRASGGSAKLVAFQQVASGAKEVAGVQLFVAQELKCVAVEFVGAGLGHDTHDRSRRKSILGVEVVGHHTKFLGCIGIGKRRCQHVVVIHAVGAVQQVIGASLPAPIG